MIIKTILSKIRIFHERTYIWAWIICVGVFIYGVYELIVENKISTITSVLIYYFAGRVVYNDIYDWFKTRLMKNDSK
jgi:hypothetical protein